MKTVEELSQNELDELRSSYWMMGIDEDTEIRKEDIPMDVVKRYYKDILFTKDDFFCNS